MANVIEAFPNGSDGTASFPEGGTTGQVLAKHSNADNDVEWKTIDVEKDVTPTENSTNAVQSGGVYTALADKVDKESGKGLSTEDYTTAEKTKLGGLSNTPIATTSTAGKVIPDGTSVTVDNDGTIHATGSGHTIEDSTGVDMTARSNLQFVGATVTDDSTNDRTVVTVSTTSKADKVTSATSGNLAGLNASGNLTDSGIASDIFPSGASSSNKLATMDDIASGGDSRIDNAITAIGIEIDTTTNVASPYIEYN